ncbi:MAG: alpha/beta hydrolase [Planctomycetota bacterium]|nr:alpha/beta hydrolase [Planctomycetota bacterium]
MFSRLLLLIAVGSLSIGAGCQSMGGSRRTAEGQPVQPARSSFNLNPFASLERSLIFAPSPETAGDWTPTDFTFEDARFTSADGTKLHGWYVPHPQPKAVVLFSHGNAGNVALWATVLKNLNERCGVSVLGYDYRGYGRSKGTPSEAGILADARAARAWLAKRSGVNEQQIVQMGRSLGGAVAVDLASTDGARGLIVESSFTSLPDVASGMAPWLPVRTVMQTKMNSLAKIKNYHGPLLQSHGSGDRLIPYEQGKKLFEAANQPKQFVEIPGRDHNDPQTEEYYVALKEFFDRL